MENLYKKTNFSNKPSRFSEVVDSEKFYQQSDALYDKYRLVSHGFIPTRLPDGSIMTRLVSDVELAVSTDPEVRAVVSAEYQEKLRLGLLSQSRGNSSRMTDDELMSNVIPSGLEPDEIASAVRYKVGMNSRADQTSQTEAPSVDAPPSEATTQS